MDHPRQPPPWSDQSICQQDDSVRFRRISVITYESGGWILWCRKASTRSPSHLNSRATPCDTSSGLLFFFVCMARFAVTIEPQHADINMVNWLAGSTELIFTVWDSHKADSASARFWSLCFTPPLRFLPLARLMMLLSGKPLWQSKRNLLWGWGAISHLLLRKLRGEVLERSCSCAFVLIEISRFSVWPLLPEAAWTRAWTSRSSFLGNLAPSFP